MYTTTFILFIYLFFIIIIILLKPSGMLCTPGGRGHGRRGGAVRDGKINRPKE